MAEPYLQRLSQIIGRLELDSAGQVTIEIKHFFSGAALYANGRICGSLSPAGFALKLPASVGQSLIDEGNGREFRFFAKGPIKRDYIALSDSIIRDERKLQQLIDVSLGYAAGASGAGATVKN